MLQDKHWVPLIKWINESYGTDISPYAELFGTRQSEATAATLRKEVENLSTLELAAFEKAVMTSKSFLIAFALVKGHLTVDQAAQASHVEVQSQIDRWGEVEDCERSLISTSKFF